MKTKILGLLISLSLFGSFLARADIAPGNYQLLEVTIAENIDPAPYSYDVKIIEKEKGRLFMVFSESKFSAGVTNEVEIVQTKNSVVFELRSQTGDSLHGCIYFGSTEGKAISGSFFEFPESTGGKFRLVPKK
jgi:hypothetical protein